MMGNLSIPTIPQLSKQSASRSSHRNNRLKYLCYFFPGGNFANRTDAIFPGESSTVHGTHIISPRRRPFCSLKPYLIFTRFFKKPYAIEDRKIPPWYPHTLPRIFLKYVSKLIANLECSRFIVFLLTIR